MRFSSASSRRSRLCREYEPIQFEETMTERAAVRTDRRPLCGFLEQIELASTATSSASASATIRKVVARTVLPRSGWGRAVLFAFAATAKGQITTPSVEGTEGEKGEYSGFQDIPHIHRMNMQRKCCLDIIHFRWIPTASASARGLPGHPVPPGRGSPEGVCGPECVCSDSPEQCFLSPGPDR